MKFKLLLLAILLASSPTYAQQSDNIAVVGFEMASTFHYVNNEFSDNFKSEFGVTTEFPFSKFSVGTGLLLKSFGKEQSLSYTGDSFTELKGENLEVYYDTYEVEQKIQYLSIPLRFQYRLPCNCMYLQAGVEANFLLDSDLVRTEDRIVSTNQSPEDYPSRFYKDKNVQFDFGAGFKIHHSDYFRIFMRPSYQIMLSPYKAESNLEDLSAIHSLKMTFGFQFGIPR